MATREKLPKEVTKKIRKMNGDRNFTYGRLVNARSTLWLIARDKTLPSLVCVRAKVLADNLQTLEQEYHDYIKANTITGANFDAQGKYKPN